MAKKEGVRVTSGTIEHVNEAPSAADRPAYLRDEKYMIAVDTETTGFNWFAGDQPFLATVSDYDRDWMYYLPINEHDEEHFEDGTAALREAVLGADALIFHNASFDIHMLVTAGVATLDELLDKEIHDTELLARVVNSREPNYRLKTLAAKYVDADAKDGEEAVREQMLAMGIIRRLDQRDFRSGAYYDVWRAAPETLEEYALKDTRITYDLFTTLLEKASEDNLLVYELERALLPTIVRMEHRGIRIDADRVADLLGMYEEMESQQIEALYEMNSGPFDINSKSHIIPFLEGANIVLTQKTETGEIRVDKGVLGRHEGVPEVDALLDYRQTEKFLTTYLRPMNEKERVHPRFIQCGAWTGRMSCREPNFQNIPIRTGPELRSMIVPNDGMSFVVADYSSIELRLLAYYMADEGLWDIINTGDPFEWLGSQIYGTTNQDEWPVKRQNLKNGFYAMTYGAGGPKLASTIGGGMTAEEGRVLRKAMEQSLGTNYSVLWSRLRKTVNTRGYVKTLARRTQIVPKDKAYVALNALIQGSAADVMKQAMIRAATALGTINAYPVLTVHDEIVAEVPTNQADLGLGLLQDAMSAAAKDLVPDGSLNLTASGVICHESYAEAK
jgi:DNA polymerase I-like protein with 3'-5' exonuclease and polymerase domains